LRVARVPVEARPLDRRILFISALAMVVALAAGFVAQLLTRLIGFFTNLAFYHRISFEFISPAENKLGLWVIGVPVIGGLVVGAMARYGSRAIRGHGIPEAMEQVLTNESKIPARITFLKPISAAIAIGTGGPFGAEGPIIATGGALGSVVGQLLETTAVERKTLLAAGAAAGMAATFGSPVSAVLLAIELLLFEYKPRSLIPVALAAATATAVRIAFVGAEPVFAMPDLATPGGEALATYVIIGALVGVAARWVTWLVYAIEDRFEKLPIHFMWWPAIGGLAVGLVGYFAPHTLGVGYDNIERILGGGMTTKALLFLCGMKLVSWSFSLGSGTSGGTLAPLFTIGGGIGAGLGVLAATIFPAFRVDPKIAALVGMAAIFAGSSRAVLASIVFAFETTRQPIGLLPLLGGCTAAYMVCLLTMKHSIMTEKIARRGVKVVGEYGADHLAQTVVKDYAAREVVTIDESHTLGEVRAWLQSRSKESQHQGFPVVYADGRVLGVLTRRDLLDPDHRDDQKIAELVRRPPVIVYDDMSLRDAADHMVQEGVGRLIVVTRKTPDRIAGVLTRSDLLAAHERRIAESQRRIRTLDLRDVARRAAATATLTGGGSH
jgi:H+/Cl- antiporter ClcA